MSQHQDPLGIFPDGISSLFNLPFSLPSQFAESFGELPFMGNSNPLTEGINQLSNIFNITPIGNTNFSKLNQKDMDSQIKNIFSRKSLGRANPPSSLISDESINNGQSQKDPDDTRNESTIIGSSVDSSGGDIDRNEDSNKKSSIF